MTDYIEFTLSTYGFNAVVEALEKLCEISKDYVEIEDYLGLIENFQDQKKEYYEKLSEEFRNSHV